MDNIRYDEKRDVWTFSLDKEEIKHFKVNPRSVQTGEFDIMGILQLFSDRTGKHIKKFGMIDIVATITKDGADFELAIEDSDDASEAICDVLEELSDDELDAIIDALNESGKIEESPKPKNPKKSEWWRYTFSSLNDVILASKRSKDIPSSLIKINGIYHLFGKGKNPITLMDHGIEENMDRSVKAYLTEHGTVILKEKAIYTLQKL